MAEDIEQRLRRIQGLAGKVESNHAQVSEMMRLMIADGLAAMRYGQFSSNNTPDPTSQAAFTAKRIVDADGYGREVIIWRDHRPEDDSREYHAAIARMEKDAELADTIRQRYMSANRDMWMRMDETDFCRPHWFVLHRENGVQKDIPRRVTGDLCKECNAFRVENGRPPEPLEVERLVTTGKWPHKLYDPKERKAV